jgi:serine/threonine protein kinase
LIGQILGNRYRILREIGSGGMAKVYLAEDMNEGQVVAVKVLNPHFGEDISYVQRFTREAKLAGALNNEHIVKILDYGASRDTYYLVMEYVEGRDLREILNERGPLEWEEALVLIDQVCEALEEAHAHDIVHRDIKPQNIMITDRGIVKVLDFGIARSRALPSLTQSGFVGSPYYISPEQAMAMGDEVDIRSDIYSTGIVLYELLSGRVPFDAQSPWSIISQHIASELPKIELKDQTIPSQVQKLLKHMVAKNPEDRFQGPTTLRRAIAALLASQELPAELGTPPPTNIDKAALADTLYRRAEAAVEAEKWPEAVGLLNQVIDLHPQHPGAFEKRAEVSTQARLTSLYTAASRALEAGRWQEAIDELTELLEIDADYRDSVKLLVQAREAIEKQNADLQLSELYEKAMAHFEAGRYEEAEVLFDQIRKISPIYRRADALWAESRRRKRTKGGFDRLNQGLARRSTADHIPWYNRVTIKWLAITILMVVSIVGITWGVSLINVSSPNPELLINDLYTRAQMAFENGDNTLASSLVRQILSVKPNHEEALTLQAQLDEIEQLKIQLAEARAAIAAKKWTSALDILKDLHTHPDFEPETITSLLCNTYLTRGKERLAGVTNPRDQATVRAALADFQAGQLICSNHEDLKTQITFATDYLVALETNVTADTIINALQPVVQAEPNYAGGQAAQNLYQAYLNRGDIFRQQNNIGAALDDYNAALNLNVADLSDAQRKQAQALQVLSESPPTTLDPVPNLTERPEFESTATAISITETVSAADFKYEAPSLISPEPYASYAGRFDEIILIWEPVNLEADEYYDVTIRYFVGEEPRYWGASLTENKWRVPVEAGYGQAGKDEFSWWVTIRQAGTDEPLSPPSEERIFIWRPE